MNIENDTWMRRIIGSVGCARMRTFVDSAGDVKGDAGCGGRLGGV